MANNKAGDALNKGIYGALRILLHLIGAVQFWYGIYYDFSFVHLPQDLRGSIKTSNFGGKFKYLTVLNAVSYNRAHLIKPVLTPSKSFADNSSFILYNQLAQRFHWNE